MASQLKADPASRDLSAQVAAQADAIRQKYGPRLAWSSIPELLADRGCIHYPCEVRFDAEPLLPGEFAHTVPHGVSPEEGFTIYLHPLYADQLSQAVYLVLHQLVLVNYGQSASADDAEIFGSRALGLSKLDYYQALCDLSARLGGDDLL